MKAILALLLGVVTAYAYTPSYSWDKEFTTAEFEAEDWDQLFNDWKVFHAREYETTDENDYRSKLWVVAMLKITEMNDEGLSFKLRMNQFGDLTDEEFKLQVHGHTGSCLRTPQMERLIPATAEFVEGEANPSSVDWQKSGDVTPVKDQGNCGSCWAFASTGCIECDYAIKHGKLTSLSEQQLVDCTRSYGNYGCDGGWWYNAFAYVKQEGGLCTESDYPYTAKDGTCQQSSCGTKYDPISGDKKVTPDSDSSLESAVATGCAAVGVEADQTAFQYYSSGVLTGTCGTSIDHGVLAVGYGTSGGTQYWKVKNSWGSNWGDNGYIYICKDCNKNGDKGECGINMYPYLVST